MMWGGSLDEKLEEKKMLYQPEELYYGLREPLLHIIYYQLPQLIILYKYIILYIFL